MYEFSNRRHRGAQIYLLISDFEAKESSLVSSGNAALTLQELKEKVATLEQELGQCRQHRHHDLAEGGQERHLQTAEAVDLLQVAGRTPAHPPDCVGESAGSGP